MNHFEIIYPKNEKNNHFFGSSALKATNSFGHPPAKRLTAKMDTSVADAFPSVKLASISSNSKENGGGTATVTLATSGNGGRWRHDDIPKEKIIDIYEAEKVLEHNN